MKNRILTRLADEYVAHMDHKEVYNDVDGSQKDHLDLLERDQNCIEKITETDDLDSANTGDCECNMCTEGGANINRIAARLFQLQDETDCQGDNCDEVNCDGYCNK